MEGSLGKIRNKKLKESQQEPQVKSLLEYLVESQDEILEGSKPMEQNIQKIVGTLSGIPGKISGGIAEIIF